MSFPHRSWSNILQSPATLSTMRRLLSFLLAALALCPSALARAFCKVPSNYAMVPDTATEFQTTSASALKAGLARPWPLVTSDYELSNTVTPPSSTVTTSTAPRLTRPSRCGQRSWGIQQTRRSGTVWLRRKRMMETPTRRGASADTATRTTSMVKAAHGTRVWILIRLRFSWVQRLMGLG